MVGSMVWQDRKREETKARKKPLASSTREAGVRQSSLAHVWAGLPTPAPASWLAGHLCCRGWPLAMLGPGSCGPQKEFKEETKVKVNRKNKT